MKTIELSGIDIQELNEQELVELEGGLLVFGAGIVVGFAGAYLFDKYVLS